MDGSMRKRQRAVQEGQTHTPGFRANPARQPVLGQ